ncbi:MAG: SDR family oxidoreductase [Paracoccaceae bacterium]
MDRVLVTGGASGIGRAMGEAFSAAGSRVWITDVDEGALAALPGGWQRSPAGAGDENAVLRLFADIEGEWGGLDVLCANAGISGPTAPVEDVRLEDWRRCISVNLEGAFLACKYAAPMMKRQGSGAIVITSSTAGLHGFPNRAPYAAAKWAVIGLMKTLAMELGPFGVRANAICPGSANGARIDGVIRREAAAKGVTYEALREVYASGTSMRTFVEGRDIANMAVFLASPDARFVSGQVISVDGHTFNPDPNP